MIDNLLSNVIKELEKQNIDETKQIVMLEERKKEKITLRKGSNRKTIARESKKRRKRK